MKVIARKCQWTGRLFDDNEKYLKHLSKMRALNAQNRAIRNANEQLQEICNWAMLNVRTAQDLEYWIRENWITLNWNGIVRSRFASDKNKICHIPKLLKITVSLRPLSQVRNSHSYPINGVQNFEGLSHLPNRYPAWEGEAKWEMSSRCECFPSYIFKGTPVRTTSGGGGVHKDTGVHTYDSGIVLWYDDWTAMAAEETKKILCA